MIAAREELLDDAGHRDGTLRNLGQAVRDGLQ